MTYYVNSGVVPAELEDMAAPVADVFSAGGGTALADNFFVAGQDFADLQEAQYGHRLDRLGRRMAPDSPFIAADEARARAQAAGVTVDVPDLGLPERALDLLIARRQRQAAQESILARGRGFGATVAGFAGGLAASFLDPVNIASAFIPVVGEARYGAMVAQAGARAGLAGRMAVRAGVGAAEGAVGAAVVEPLTWMQRHQMGDDYSLGDAFANVAFGAALGGIAHIALRPDRLHLPADGPVEAATAAARPQERDGALLTAVDQAAAGDAVDVARTLVPGHQEPSPAALAGHGADAALPSADIALPHAAIRDDVAITPGGSEVPVRYAIVAARDLVTSHSDELQVNPSFPAALQPRDRSRDASRLQVQDIEQHLRPELLMEQPQADQGAPVIGPDGVVESGNGRMIAVRRAYAAGSPQAAAYRDALVARGYPVAGIDQPVLVRIRTDARSTADRAAFAADANTRVTAAMSATEQALADARTLPDHVLGLHQGGDLMAAANRDFVRAAIDAVPPAERGALIDAQGALSQEGVRRISNMLIAKAYGADDLLRLFTEAANGNLRTIGGGLLDAAPAWARMRGLAASGQIDPRVDRTDALVAAVRLVRRAREERRNLAEFVGQSDIFGGDLDPAAKAFLSLMFRDDAFTRPLGRDKLAEALNYIAAEAEKTQPGPGLFGEATNVEALITAARQRALGERSAPERSVLARDGQDPAARGGGRSEPGAQGAGGGDLAPGGHPAAGGLTRPAKGEPGWQITPAEVAAHPAIEPVVIPLRPEWLALSRDALRAEAKAWLVDNLQKASVSLTNEDTGWHNIRVGRVTVKKLTADRAKDEVSGRPAVELHSTPGLPELMKRAVLVESRLSDRAEVVVINRFYVPARIGEDLYRVKLTVKESPDGRRLYDHRAALLEAAGGPLTEQSVAHSGLADQASSQPRTAADQTAVFVPPANSAIKLDALLRDVNFDNRSRILSAVPAVPERDAEAVAAAARTTAAESAKPPDDLWIDAQVGALDTEQALTAEDRATLADGSDLTAQAQAENTSAAQALACLIRKT